MSVGVLAALVTGSALLPGAAGRVVPGVVSVLASAGAVGVVLARSRGSRHPAAWRWYAASLAAGTAGSLGVPLVASGVEVGVLSLAGAVPGSLLSLLALALLRPPGLRRVGLAHPACSLALFVVATLLGLHTVLHLVEGGGDGAGAHVLSHVVVVTAAVSVAAALLLLTVARPAVRPVARRVLAAQGTYAAAMTVAVLSADGHHPLLQVPVWPLAVLSVAALCAAARCDRDTGPVAGPTAPGSDVVGALLPHLMVLAGGSLFVFVGLARQHLEPIDTVLAGTGLTLVLVHQALTWRNTDRLTRELARSGAYFRALVRSSGDPVVILDERLRISYASAAISQMLGLDPERIVGKPVARSVHPEDQGSFVAGMWDGTAGTAVRTARIRHADGSWRLLQATVRDLRDDPDVGALVLYCRDVTRATTDAEQVELATVDPETGLPNRAALLRRLGLHVRAASRTVAGRGAAPSTAVVVLGVTGLDGGDVRELESRSPGARGAVLEEVAARLARGLREGDWLARGHGGEFVAVVEGSLEDAKAAAARLVADVQPVATPAGTLRLTAAAGVTDLQDGVDAGEALRRADLALRTARAEGPGRVRCYDDALRMVQDRRARLRADLEGAVRRGEMRLVFQPIVDLALHRTTSVEALLRWRHPEFGEVSPAEFVPLAEESPLIGELSRWVLTEACRTASTLGDDGPAVAVNLSARHVRSGELVHDVLTALERTGLPATRLVLEITESLLLDDAHVVGDLQALRTMGCRVAVDDFGTGWSSLAYLVDLPIDVLKMDRQFLAGFDSDAQRRALCRAVLQLGASLDLAVVVEGVETPVELGLLRDMGHRFVQGYLLSRPLERPVLLAREWESPTEAAAGGGTAAAGAGVSSPRG